MKDLIDEIDAVTRTVGAATMPAGAARTVTLQRTYPADIADVWDAITDPERIARWFLPIDGDLREGGTYRFEGNASGDIRTCKPPSELVVTWNPPHEEQGPADASTVTVRLRTTDDGDTLFELEHVAVVPPEFWDQFGPGAVGVGWDRALVGLAAHLGGIQMGSPEELDRDPAVRDGMRASSDAWGVAYAAAGASPETVAAAVAATTAFYVPPLT
jgi:uncharacterized protein YndB with AHSA1/START domain